MADWDTNVWEDEQGVGVQLWLLESLLCSVAMTLANSVIEEWLVDAWWGSIIVWFCDI